MRKTLEASQTKTLLALVGSVMVVGALLWEPITHFDTHVWGPEYPWTHRDFLGAYWLFWAAPDVSEKLAQTQWPQGGLSLLHHIPNPFDALLLGPLLFPNDPDQIAVRFPFWWNLLQLGHHIGNVTATVLLARTIRCGAVSSWLAGCLVAASPIMLHEIAGGRTLSGAVWPGLLSLMYLMRGNSLRSGAALCLQSLSYLYTGLVFALIAVILWGGGQQRPRRLWRFCLGLSPLIVYLLWLWPRITETGAPPPAGFTALPLSGMLGLNLVPERFRLHPALWLGLLALLPWCHARIHKNIDARWLLLAAGTAVVIALGPTPTWAMESTTLSSPMQWAMQTFPGLARMHHPVRAAMVGVPLLAIITACVLEIRPRILQPLMVLLLIPMAKSTELATSWTQEGQPPGVTACEWLRANGSAVVDLTGDHGAALGLQPFHGLPMLEGLRRSHGPTRAGSSTLRRQADGWLRNETQPGLAQELVNAGFSHLLFIPRPGEASIEITALEADLGPPIVPHVYALSQTKLETTPPPPSQEQEAQTHE